MKMKLKKPAAVIGLSLILAVGLTGSGGKDVNAVESSLGMTRMYVSEGNSSEYLNRVSVKNPDAMDDGNHQHQIEGLVYTRDQLMETIKEGYGNREGSLDLRYVGSEKITSEGLNNELNQEFLPQEYKGVKGITIQTDINRGDGFKGDGDDRVEVVFIYAN